MSGPEDTGSNTVEDAARFERWRARNYDPPEDDGLSVEDQEDMGLRPRLSARSFCRCHSASETPCDFCSEGP